MEAEERPAKIRKLEPSCGTSPEDLDALNGNQALTNDNEEPGPSPNLPEESQNADSKETVDDSTPRLSKNQQKKLRRQQVWEAGREDRKVKRKEQIKARKERKRAAQQAGADAQAQDPQSVDAAPVLFQKWKALQLPVTFLFDCSYDDLMMDKEMKSLASQLTRCYADNSRAKFRAHITISSFVGKLRDRFDTVLSKHYLGWKGVRFFDEGFETVAGQAMDWMQNPKGGVMAGIFSEHAEKERDSLIDEGEIIYLSSDSDVTLTHLKPYSTYIIGGLVDRNRHKAVCHRKATELGFKTAKLPIGQYLEMNSRSVLATNHVSQIMLKWLECGDWGEAFMQVIPKRKGGVLRTGEEGSQCDDEQIEEKDDAEDDLADDGSQHSSDNGGERNGKNLGAVAETTTADEAHEHTKDASTAQESTEIAD